MPAADKARRLEVVLLGLEGLSRGRWKVQITLVSSRDPYGEAFGAKVSPWDQVEAVDGTGTLHFGSSGLHCSFPLAVAGGAPSLVADPRFNESANLRVRLYEARDSASGTALRAASKLLPSSIKAGATEELDAASSELQAEMKIPLTNILSGRVGFAADRVLGGWVPLQRKAATKPSNVVEDVEVGPRAWMQMYVLPDHEAMLPALSEQRTSELAKQRGSINLMEAGEGGEAVPAPSPAVSSDLLSMSDAVVELSPSDIPPAPARTEAGEMQIRKAETGSAPPRWGPLKKSTEQTAKPVANLIELEAADLIDIDANGCAEVSQGVTSSPVVEEKPATSNGNDLLHDLAGDFTVSPQLPVEPIVETPQGVTASAAAVPAAPAATSFVPQLQQEVSVAPELQQGGSSSAFSFIQHHPATASVPSNGAGQSAEGGTSAFGFIASSSATPQLDLAALYASESNKPRPQVRIPQHDYSALSNLANPQPQKVALSQERPSMGGLERTMLDGLGDSLKDRAWRN